MRPPSASPRVRVRRRRCRHRRRLPRGASLPLRLSARCCASGCPVGVAMRAFGVRLRRDALSPCSYESRCEPSETGFGACHIRSALPRGGRRCASLVLVQYAGASLRRSASARCPSVSCCHGAVGRCACLDLVQFAMRVVRARLRRVPASCRHEVADGARPSISSGSRCTADVAIDGAVRPFQCGLRHGDKP